MATKVITYLNGDGDPTAILLSEISAMESETLEIGVLRQVHLKGGQTIIFDQTITGEEFNAFRLIWLNSLGLVKTSETSVLTPAVNRV